MNVVVVLLAAVAFAFALFEEFNAKGRAMLAWSVLLLAAAVIYLEVSAR
jgi:hypothetical protein